MVSRVKMAKTSALPCLQQWRFATGPAGGVAEIDLPLLVAHSLLDWTEIIVSAEHSFVLIIFIFSIVTLCPHGPHIILDLIKANQLRVRLPLIFGYVLVLSEPSIFPLLL